jgi:beta-glucosidase
MKMSLRYFFAALACCAAPLLALAQPVTNEPAFRDPGLPAEQRVTDLLSRLTTQEKISQLMMSSPAIPRLGLPPYHWWNEALHGVARNGTATVFPQAIALAATWNPALHQRIASAISTEARAKNNATLLQTGGGSDKYQGLTLWSPNINIFRDPRWGRGQETYGEDPFLTGRLGVAFVRGLQGDDPHFLKTVATVKHFAVHSGPEPLRHRFNAVVSARDLRETYLPAFEACIREGGALSLMSAYNAVNGVPAPANQPLLGDILRGEWGFQGAVVGDVDTVADMWRKGTHEYCKDAAEASALAVRTGTDLCSGTTYEALPEALQRGLVTQADLDRALRRLLLLRFRLGQFDPADRVAYRRIPATEIDSPAHDQLAWEAARQSLVLLKNDGTLPWNAKTLKTVAILGPTGNEESALLGNYNGTPARMVTLLKGLKARLEPLGVKVLAESAGPLVQGYRISGQPFPDGVLFADDAHRRAGLKGEVFGNPKLEGAPSALRTDPQVNLQWDEAQPLPNLPATDASLRWTGVLAPALSGEYILSLALQGSARLFIDDQCVIDAWKKGGERTVSAPVQLQAGRNHRVRLEFAQTRPKAHIQFGWKAPGSDDALERALAAARQADHIVLTLGLTPNLEGEEMSVTAEGFQGGDRTSIQLPRVQQELMGKVFALKKPTVVVLTTGSAVSFDPQQADAVLLCWYYGQRGSDAVADALLGEYNPAGRLPVTFYRDDRDLPPFENYAMTNRTYRYFTGQPLYAFGHGLSYTTFDYQNLSLTAASARPEDTVTVRVTVKNTGARDGDEVVQVYATAVHPPVSMPLRQLVGFQRLFFKAGETQTVEVPVPVQRLRRWDEAAKHYVVDPGDYALAAGPASDQPLLKATLHIH